MDAEKAALMQMQIRNNASDLQDYLKGLEAWETDVKTTDASLSNQKSILKEKLPPVRGVSRTKATKKKSKQVKIEARKPPRIKSHDFKAWDKFDVDGACEAVDYQVESTSSSEGEENEQEAVRKQQAIYEKEKGNDLFKEGRYELAIECYSKAAELDPLNAVMPANKAMALLKLQKYASAESNCSLALTLDDRYLKAYLRRGTARLKLGRVEEARDDFTVALRLEPGNKIARSELNKLNKERDKKFVQPVKRPPHLRSKKPLKHITIEDIGEEQSDTTVPPTTTTPHIAADPTSSQPKNTNEKAPNVSLQISEITNSKPHQITDTIGTQPKATDTTMESSHAQSISKKRVLIETLISPESSSDHPQPSTKMSVVSTELKPSTTKDIPGNADSAVKKDLSVMSVVKLPSVPENSITLQRDWKRVRRDRGILGEYFKSIPVSKYPALLQQSLETDIFSDIVTILLEDFVRVGVVCLAQLQALTRVRRFSVALMFLSTTDQKNLKELFHELKALVKEQEESKLLKELSARFGF